MAASMDSNSVPKLLSEDEMGFKNLSQILKDSPNAKNTQERATKIKTSKKDGIKSKLVDENGMEFNNLAQFLKDSSNAKKTQKRAKKNKTFDKDDNKSELDDGQASAKKKKPETRSGTNPDSRKKILDYVGNQLEARKQCNATLFKCLLDIITQSEADYNALKENKMKLKHLMGTYMVCNEQAISAYKHKLEALKEIQASFQKECADMESDNIIKAEKLVEELEYVNKTLQDKLVAESKRSSWESMRQGLSQAMQNYF